VINYHRISCSK